MRGPLLAALCAAWLSCAAAPRRPELAGLSAEALLRCAGVPAVVSKRGESTSWVYAAARKLGHCDADVELSGDKVVRVTYRSAGEGADELCAAFFKSCLPVESRGAPKEAQKTPASTSRCPEGWDAKGNDSCYPIRPLFGGSTK